MEKFGRRSGPCVRSPVGAGGFCGGCYSNMRGRSNYPGHQGYRARPRPLSLFEVLNMKRQSAAPPVKKGEWSCCDATFKKDYPALAQAMCDEWWDDGKPRVPFTLTIRLDAGACNLCLNDKEGSRGAYTSADDLWEGLTLLNEALATETLSWRKWKR